MATVQILFWHGIPLQVRAQDPEGRASLPLSPRFQDAVDKVAVAVGLIADDDYTAGFNWGEKEERQGTAQEVAAAVAAELEVRYARIDWRQIAISMGAQNP